MRPIEVEHLMLHPGSPKTGTSGLQNFLFRKREQLLSLGYLYPEAGIPKTGDVAKGHHEISLQLAMEGEKPSEKLRAALEALREEIARHPGKTVILSSEVFFGHARIDALRRYLRAQHCEAYVSLRPQYELLNANYYTEVTHRRNKLKPGAYFDRAITQLQYLAKMQAIEAFAPETVIGLRIFEKGSAARKSPIEDFLSIMGIALDYDASDNVVEHVTLPAQPTLFLRYINELDFDPQTFFQIFKAFHRMRPLFSQQIYTMSPKRIADIEREFDEENRTIRRLYLDGKDEPLFAPAVIPDAKEWERDVGEDIAKIEREFLKRLCLFAAKNVA